MSGRSIGAAVGKFRGKEGLEVDALDDGVGQETLGQGLERVEAHANLRSVRDRNRSGSRCGFVTLM